MKEADSILIGNIRLTLVHPDMVRLYDEDTADAVTLKVWDVGEALRAVMDGEV